MNKQTYAKDHDIYIDEEKCNVHVVNMSKSRWKAYGFFRKKYIEETNSSESSALSSWMQKAEYEASS